MPPNITEIEQKILDYMVEYLRTNTYQPSIREIGEQFGIKSTKTVSEHLQALAEKGFLERDPSRSRGVKILGMDLNAHAVSVPCFRNLPVDRNGQRAGRAEMHLTLDRRLAGEKGAFFVQARAEELAFLGCMEGDYVLLEPASPTDLVNGAIVAARVEEASAYYRFLRIDGTAELHPLGGKGLPTVLEHPADLVLIGRVTGLYRRLDHASVSSTTTTH
jgi:repressor LexA